MKKLFENWRKHLNEDEEYTTERLNEFLGERFTRWFAAYSRGPTGGYESGHKHIDKAPVIAKILAKDLRAGKFLDVVRRQRPELEEQYTELFENLAKALEQNPLLAHSRKLGKRGNWLAIATGNWDESMYNPPRYTGRARRDYGWEDISDEEYEKFTFEGTSKKQKAHDAREVDKKAWRKKADAIANDLGWPNRARWDDEKQTYYIQNNDTQERGQDVPQPK
jgi:hypothetical protein